MCWIRFICLMYFCVVQLWMQKLEKLRIMGLFFFGLGGWWVDWSEGCGGVGCFLGLWWGFYGSLPEVFRKPS